MKPCTVCGCRLAPFKVIYFGLPGRLCDRCGLLTGLAAYAPIVATETEEGS